MCRDMRSFSDWFLSSHSIERSVNKNWKLFTEAIWASVNKNIPNKQVNPLSKKNLSG